MEDDDDEEESLHLGGSGTWESVAGEVWSPGKTRDEDDDEEEEEEEEEHDEGKGGEDEDRGKEREEDEAREREETLKRNVTFTVIEDADAWPRTIEGGTKTGDEELTAAEDFFAAVEAGSLETAEHLLGEISYLANVSRRVGSVGQSETPLYVACGMGDVRMVERLLDANAIVQSRMEHGHTALHAAALFGHPSVVEMLLQRGANAFVVNAEGLSLLDEVLEDILHHHLEGDEGEAALLEDSAILLLQHGAKIVDPLAHADLCELGQGVVDPKLTRAIRRAIASAEAHAEAEAEAAAHAEARAQAREEGKRDEGEAAVVIVREAREATTCTPERESLNVRTPSGRASAGRARQRRYVPSSSPAGSIAAASPTPVKPPSASSAAAASPLSHAGNSSSRGSGRRRIVAARQPRALPVAAAHAERERRRMKMRAAANGSDSVKLPSI